MDYKRYCCNCGTLFETDRNTQKYCSAECKTNAHKKGNAIRRRKPTTKTRVKYFQFCSICGKKYERTSNNSRYCSTKCKNKANDDYKRIRKIWDKKYRIKTRENAIRNGRRYRKQGRNFLNKLKVKSSCELCGEQHPACLVFHHKNPQEKLYNTNSMLQQRYSIKKIKKEIKKCSILCANCHRKLHYEERKNGK